MGFADLESSLVGERVLRPAVDVQITAGRKGANGAPTDKDKLFLMRHRPDRRVKSGTAETDARSPYPGLDDLQGSTALRGVVLLESWQEVTTGSGFVAYRPPGQPAGQNGRPWCSSPDGETATRWSGRAWETIACPNRQCPHFMADRGCRVQTSLVFALREPGFPSLLSRWTTRSIYTFDNLVAFRRTVADHMRAMRLPESWFGVPFRISVRMKATAKGLFPVQDITLDGALGDALLAGNRLRAELAQMIAGLPAALLTAGDYPDADDHDLGPGARVLSAPATLPKACPSCAAAMTPVQGKTGLGWGCATCSTFIGPDGTVHKREM